VRKKQVAGDGGQTIFTVFEVFGSEPRTPSLPFFVRVSCSIEAAFAGSVQRSRTSTTTITSTIGQKMKERSPRSRLVETKGPHSSFPAIVLVLVVVIVLDL
jgi:hypothetical protein